MTQLPLVADDLCARELMRQGRAVVVDYDSEFQGADLQARHLLAPNLYLHSMAFEAGPVPSASSSDSQLQSSLGRRFKTDRHSHSHYTYLYS